MHIRSYQVHNILKAYTRQLTGHQSNAMENEKMLSVLSEGGKRQKVIEKVTDNIIEKITSLESREETPRKVVSPKRELLEKRADFEETKFAYYTFEQDKKIFHKVSSKKFQVP